MKAAQKPPKGPQDGLFLPSQSIPAGVILASTSARRHEFLTQIGIVFEVATADIPEKKKKGEEPLAMAERLAREKALAVSGGDNLVIGMDTIVTLDQEIMGKPRDAKDAVRMLKRLSQKIHSVISGAALVYRGTIVSGTAVTRVHFRKIHDEEIAWYVATKEPYDKAGAYAIQGNARLFIRKIDGDYYNVVGFPVFLFQQLLAKLQLTVYDLIRK